MCIRDSTHTTDFTVLNPIEGQEWAAGDNIQVSLTVKVPACRWHKNCLLYTSPDCPCEISLYYDHAPYSFGFTQRYPDGRTGTVERLQCYGKRSVRYSMIEQTSHDTCPSVGIALCKAERVRGMVVVE